MNGDGKTSTASSRKSSTNSSIGSGLEDVDPCGLQPPQLRALKRTFDQFDGDCRGHLPLSTINLVLKMLNMHVSKHTISDVVHEIDLQHSGLLTFPQFVQLAARLLVEEDEEETRWELKEAFRIYDKQGNGYITTESLKEILREIDPTLDDEAIEELVEEVDEDDSGTVDLAEFMAMMTGH